MRFTTKGPGDLWHENEPDPHGFWCDCPHCEPARCERCRESICDEPGCGCPYPLAVVTSSGLGYCGNECALADLTEVVQEFGCGAWFWYIDRNGGPIDARD